MAHCSRVDKGMSNDILTLKEVAEYLKLTKKTAKL
jgi:hypothetical protein